MLLQSFFVKALKHTFYLIQHQTCQNVHVGNLHPPSNAKETEFNKSKSLNMLKLFNSCNFLCSE